MTDKKISQLANISGADLADSDEFVVARASTSENFAVTKAELLQGSGVVVDDDFTSNGLLKRTAEGVYGIAVEDTDYQGVPAEGAFVDGDKTKLDGIEAGADVTDTANVTAAGALMDSELTDEAAVKALAARNFASRAALVAAWDALSAGEKAAIPGGTVWTWPDNFIVFMPAGHTLYGTDPIPDLAGWATFGATLFDTVSALIADTTVWPEGKYLEADGFRYEVAASGATDHHLTTAGGVKLYVKPFGENYYSVKAFGCTAAAEDAAANATALQACVDQASSDQATVLVDQTVRFSSTITLGVNTRIKSGLTGFANRLIPVDCAPFTVDGVDGSGGFAFEIKIDDIMIDLSEITVPVTNAMLFKNAYRCHMRRVRFHDAIVNTSTGITTVIKTEGTCNHLIFEDIVINGQANTGSGILVDLAHDEGSVTFKNPDLENAYFGMRFGGNVVADVYSPYFERLGTGFVFTPATSADGVYSVNIYGGTVKVPSASSRALRFEGTFSRDEKIVIDGLEFQTSNHATKTTMFSASAFIWQNEHPLILSNLDFSWITDPPQSVINAARFSPVHPFNNTGGMRQQKFLFQIDDLADATATDIFRLSEFNDTTPYQPVLVKVRAFTSHYGYGRAIDHAEWIIQARNGTNPYVGTKQSIVSLQEDDAANYSITTFTVTAASSTLDEVDFQITSDFNNSIVTTLNEVFFEVEVLGECSVALL